MSQGLGALGLWALVLAASPDVTWEREGRVVLELRWERRSGGLEREQAATRDATSGEESAAARRAFPWRQGRRLGEALLARSWMDARGQEIAPGRYVVRYGLQPLSKDHAGTTAARDFLVLVPATLDAGDPVVTPARMLEWSRSAGSASHPAVLEIRDPGAAAADAEADESVVVTEIDGIGVALVLAAPARSPF